MFKKQINKISHLYIFMNLMCVNSREMFIQVKMFQQKMQVFALLIFLGIFIQFAYVSDFAFFYYFDQFLLFQQYLIVHRVTWEKSPAPLQHSLTADLVVIALPCPARVGLHLIHNHKIVTYTYEIELQFGIVIYYSLFLWKFVFWWWFWFQVRFEFS